MRTNRVKEKLNAGEVVTGVVLQEASLSLVEILGLLGFDFIFIDCEHSPMNTESVLHLILGAEIRGITPLVRVPQNSPEYILPYLDSGAMGIIIPDMSSSEEATMAINAVKYLPQGQRGLAGVRSADYGLRGSLKEYVKIANKETIVFGVVESIQGVANIEEVLSTEGLDGMIIGTNDLSNSIGAPGETRHPLVLEAIEKILAAGRHSGKAIGGLVRGVELPKNYKDQGFRIIMTSLISLIVTTGKQFLQSARS